MTDPMIAFHDWRFYLIVGLAVAVVLQNTLFCLHLNASQSRWSWVAPILMLANIIPLMMLTTLALEAVFRR